MDVRIAKDAALSFQQYSIKIKQIKRYLEKSLDRIKRRLQLFDSPFDAPTAAETPTVFSGHDYTAGLIIRRMVKRRHVRKGVQLYLTDIAALPARLVRLPGILLDGGFKELIRRAERRGAAEYDRRAANR